MAVASFLDARSHHGKWLLRIDDLDVPRVSKQAELQIVESLLAHGLNWDDPIVHQQDRRELYQAFLGALRDRCETFFCTCSRREIDRIVGCVASCRFVRNDPAQPHTIRIHMEPYKISFDDRVQGRFQSMEPRETNIAVWRREAIPTYPLSVVADDAASSVTHVVRGADLLANTAHQIFLQQQLQLNPTSFAHLPVLNERTGVKLSKRDAATCIHDSHAHQNLVWALQLLGMDPPQQLRIDSLLEWAIATWNIDKIPSETEISDFVSL